MNVKRTYGPRGLNGHDWRVYIYRRLRINSPGKLGLKQWRQRRDRHLAKRQEREEDAA